MSVRFKFKNDLDYQPIPCDGYHISVRDLKKSIVRRKKLGKVTDFDLVVTNSQTNHVYNVDDELIAKNTTLVVQRAPLSEGKKKVWEEETGHVESVDLMSSNSATNSYSGIPSLNISQSLGDTEEDKISKMMSNSSEMYSEKHWTRYRGQKALPEGAKPPPHWKCSKCLGNHWVTDCPFANNDLKRTTGIPRSFLKPADSNVPGAKINPQGLIVVNEMEKLAYSEKKIEKNPWLLEDEKPSVVKVNIPSELLCPICKELLCDAVMMPCCAGSACDECARNGIIENEGGRCTVCGEVANPEELIPYRLFRDKVDRFRNQTGYSKPPAQGPAPVSIPVKPSLPDIVLPDPTDNNFKFDALIGHRANPGLKVDPPNLSILQSAEEVASRSPTKTPGTPGTPTADSPPRRTPHTPTSTPPRSPSTPRSRSGDRRSPPPLAPASLPPMMDMSVPPPNMTLLPPGNVLSQPPAPHYPPAAHLVPPPHYHHPPPTTLINPAEDPLAAFEAAMRKLDSKKANRGRSPPRAYQDGGRSRSRERYRDYYERSRDYSPRRRSPGYYSPPRRGDSRAPHRRSPSPGKGGGSRRRFVHEIPPETEQEKRERERYEREFVERERRKGESYEPSNHKHRVAPTPPRDFLEREVRKEHNDSNRTPSLSPEPLNQHTHHIKSSEMDGQTKLPIIRDERDLDNSDEKEPLREASPRRDKIREDREEEERERNERRVRQEDQEQRRSRERETRYQEGRDDRSRYHRDRERERGRHDRRDRDRERSRDRHDRDDKERNIEDEKSKERDRHDKENISLDNGHVEHSEDDKELRKSKKEKKSKKSKKKNKKKDRDSDSDGEEEEKVSKKKKTKKDRKKKDKEHDVSHGEEKEDDAGESRDDGNESDNERSSGPDSSPKEPSSDVKQLDQSKFINSFSEAKVDDTKTKLSLPTLVFNDKTEELAPKETKEEASDDQMDKDDSFETKLSKWEEDELNLEAQQINEQSKLSKADNGPSAIKSSREIHHVETDRDEKKRKSRSVGEEEDSRNGQDNQIKKKKKKRKSISEAESDESEDEDNKSKKKKKKKKGLDIPEKTLKKLLKKNLLKKKALENLLKDGPKKKKKKRKSGDRSDSDHSDEDNSEDRIVRRVKSSSEKPARREDSDEERKVKSSREGNLQIRVDNASSVREDSRSGSNRTLTNSIQASLMKLSTGRSKERESPARKSVKERLGPVGGGGGESLRERLGRKETGGKAKEKEKESPRESNLGSLPADLKAWADRKASSPSPTRRKQRRRSRSREKMAPARDRSRSRDRRRRSRSRGDQRRKRSRSAERSRNGEKIASKSNGRSYSIKRRKNDRLDKDRGRHSDSD